MIVIRLCDKVSCDGAFASVGCCQNVIVRVLAWKLMGVGMDCSVTA